MTNLLVEVRIKPNSRNVIEFSNNSIVVGSKIFTFSKVHCKTTQMNLCTNSVQPFVDKFIEGQNCTIMAYGQTGSGKTYTMGMSHKNEKGIVQYVLDAVTKLGLTCRCSFIEIYNEEIYDLLSDKRDFISLRQQGDQISLVGLTEREFASYKDGIDLLKRGCLNRTTKSTKMNSESSRSHALFSISYLIEQDGVILEPTFYFVDLAGSERLKRTECVGKTARESISINAGLLSLGNVISALYHKKTHIPYRDSKLTRILQKCLNSNALLIACVSGLQEDTFETANTLKYASRAAMISLNTKVHVENDKDKLVILNLKKEISSLKEENNRLRITTISKGITDDKIRSHPLVAELLRRLKKYEGENVLDNIKAEISEKSDSNYGQYTDSYINHRNSIESQEQSTLINKTTKKDANNKGGIAERSVKLGSYSDKNQVKFTEESSYGNKENSNTSDTHKPNSDNLLEKIRQFNEKRAGVFNFKNPVRSELQRLNRPDNSGVAHSLPKISKNLEYASVNESLMQRHSLDNSKFQTDDSDFYQRGNSCYAKDNEVIQEQIKDLKIEDSTGYEALSSELQTNTNNTKREENFYENYKNTKNVKPTVDDTEVEQEPTKSKLFYANIENLNLLKNNEIALQENGLKDPLIKKRKKIVTFDLNPRPKCTLFTPLKESKSIKFNLVNTISDYSAISLVLHKDKLFFNCIDSKIRYYDNGVAIALSDDSIRCMYSNGNLYYSSRSLLKSYNDIGRPMPVFAYKNEISCLKVYNNYILTGHDDGTVSFLDKRSNKLVFSEKLHSSTVFDAIVLNDFFFSGSRDHSVKFNKFVPDKAGILFENQNFIDLSPPHYDSVNTVLSFKDKCITMGRDASIKVWNEDKPFKTVPYAHDAWIKAGYATDSHIFTGCKNGTIKAWDFISQSIRSVGRVETGSCINSIVANQTNLWVSCQNKTIQNYEISNS